MSFKTDAEIAQSSTMHPIGGIVAKLGLNADNIELYGRYKAGTNLAEALELPQKQGRLVLVTAISPIPVSGGKTTVAIGLADALRHIGKGSVIALHEPSLGPVFGVRGGTTGDGYAQVLPVEDVNLHSTGDFHAIDAANNLLAAILDDHIYQDDELNIDPKRVLWRHVVDMNNRQLRNIIDGMGKPVSDVIRLNGFNITVASEVMTIFCLARDIGDLRERLGNILAACARGGGLVYAKGLKVHGAMTALLGDVIKPNLVQTIEGTPAFIHGGPFANTAHGYNSATATRPAKRLVNYTVTEAGFGADLGTEKFCSIRCRLAGLRPDAVVVVATVHALKYDGGIERANLGEESLKALAEGSPNLPKHIFNLKSVFGLPIVVAINRFVSDSDVELVVIEKVCVEYGVEVSLTKVWGKGGVDDADLTYKVVNIVDSQPNNFSFAYDVELSIKDKIRAIAQEVHGAEDVDFSAEASAEIASLEELGLDKMPVCTAKTRCSLSDSAKLLGCPEGFRITVRDITISADAGFTVILYGNMMKMPSLPKVPAAKKIDMDTDDVIHGLF